MLVVVFVTIFVISLLSLLPPLLIRDLLDGAIPDEDLGRVTLLGLGMVAVPLINGGVGIIQRWGSAASRRGNHLRPPLPALLPPAADVARLLHRTKTGELMSRLNNDVVGAQQAVTGTFVSLVSNHVSVVVTLAIMFGIEWRLTLLSVVMLPVFIFTSRQVGRRLRVVRRDQMQQNARDEFADAGDAERIGRAARQAVRPDHATRTRRFARRAEPGARPRCAPGHDRPLVLHGARHRISALGTALVFWFGAVMVINGTLTVGDIVAMSLYLTNLYGPLSALSNARVEFATALVSFERVFEVHRSAA